MNKSTFTSFILIAVLMTGCGRVKRSLTVELYPGAVHRYTVSSSQTFYQSVMDTTMELTQTTTWLYVLQVVDIDDRSIATIDLMFDEIGMESEGPLGSLTYHSWENANEVPGAMQAFSQLLDKHVTVRVSPDGSVLSVVGAESIIDGMLTALGLDADSPSADQMRKDLRNQFGNRAIAEALSVLFPHYPWQQVGPGDAWGDETNFTCGLPITVRNTWQLRRILDGNVVLDAFGIIGPNPGVRFVAMPGTELYYRLRGNRTGEYTINGSDGWVISGNIHQQLEGVIVVSGMVAGDQQAVQWPLRVSETITIEARDIKDSTAASR